MTLREFIKIGDRQAAYYIFDEDANLLEGTIYESAMNEDFIELTYEVIDWEIDRRFDNCINVYVQTRE